MSLLESFDIEKNYVPGICLCRIGIVKMSLDLKHFLIYDALNITFMVDEGMLAWLEIHDWLRAMTFPTEFEEYQKL